MGLGRPYEMGLGMIQETTHQLSLTLSIKLFLIKYNACTKLI